MRRDFTVHGLRFMVYGSRISALALVFFFCAGACHAYTVSSNELIEKAKDLDGREVVYRGELVTDILKRGGHVWINLNDGDNAIGVWCRMEHTKTMTYAGDYQHRGDIVEVYGIFNRACGEHGGELDIHAYRVDVVRTGFYRWEKMDKGRAYAAIIFFLLTLFIMSRYRQRM